MIPEKYLKLVEGKQFFYPCAGYDYIEAVNAFFPYIIEFTFCDLIYNFKSDNLFLVGDDFIFLTSEIIQYPEVDITEKTLYCRSVRPEMLINTYVHKTTKKILTLKFRTGFGQYALQEFEDKSIGVFMHRGDSATSGESSSNVFYLGNKKRNHEILSNLFDKLSLKLSDNALIVSDGSNCKTKFLKKFFKKEISGDLALEELQFFNKWNYTWNPVGHMNNKYGPTIVWQIYGEPVKLLTAS